MIRHRGPWHHIDAVEFATAEWIDWYNLPFSGWAGVFGDQAVAAAMIDRIGHHADVLTLKAPATASEAAASTASQHQNHH